MDRIVENQYKFDITKAQMKRIGFKYDYDLDDYVYKFPVYSYKNIPLVFCKLGIDEETKRVWLGMYDANNVMYSSYYDREYGKNSIIKNIEKAISKELNKLGVKKVN